MKKWLFTLFYFIPSIALAAPSITSVSGTVADGQFNYSYWIRLWKQRSKNHSF